MGDPPGEADRGALRLDFDRRLRYVPVPVVRRATQRWKDRVGGYSGNADALGRPLAPEGRIFRPPPKLPGFVEFGEAAFRAGAPERGERPRHEAGFLGSLVYRPVVFKRNQIGWIPSARSIGDRVDCGNRGMRIGVVGSWRRTDREAVEACIAEFTPETVVVTGGARGPDRWAEQAARARGLGVVVHEPDLSGANRRWQATKRYYARNQTIVDDSDKIIAFVAPDRAGGTEDTIRRAERAGKPFAVTSSPDFYGI